MKTVLFLAVMSIASMSHAKYCSGGWMHDDDGKTLEYLGDSCLQQLQHGGDYYCDGGWLKSWSGSTISYIGDTCNQSFNETFYCDGGWLKNIKTGATLDYLGDECLKNIAAQAGNGCKP